MVRQLHLLRAMRSDLRHALRALRRSPGFTLAAIATLAIGISANVGVFGVVDALLLRPLPFPASDRLVRITGDFTRRGTTDVGVDVPQLADFRARTDLFDAVSGVYPANANLTGVAEPERIEVQLVSASYFDVLSVRPALGRLLARSDELATGAAVGVITDQAWRRRFGSDPAVVGRVIRLDTDPIAIVGVLEPGFHHPGSDIADEPEVFVPTSYQDSAFGAPTRGRFAIRGGLLARLRPGVTVSRASETLAAMGAALASAHPDAYPASLGWTPRLVPLQDDLVGGIRRSLVAIFAAVGALLVVACANVAGLLLARGSARAREFTIRAALGASRARLVVYGLVEGGLLAIAGGALSLLFTRVILGALLALAPARLPRAAEIGVDWRVFAFAAGLSAATGWLFSLWPAWQASRAEARDVLAARTITAGVHRARARRIVVSGEIAVALTLLVLAALLGRSFLALSRVDPGFRPDGVLTARLWMSLPNDRSTGAYATRDAMVALLEQSVARVEALPGVVRAGWTSALPFGGSAFTQGFLIESRPIESSLVDVAEPMSVTPGYFDALRISLVQGRVFTDADSPTAAPVMIVSESVARRYFPDGRAIGARVRPGGPSSTAPWITIVGIVHDVRSVRLDASPGAQMYRCAWQRPDLAMTLVARVAGDPTAYVDATRRAVRSVDANVPLFDIRPMTTVIGASVAERRFALRLIAAFAALALLLAAVGISGVVAQVVTQRTTEIGIRVALGATATDVARMVLGDGVGLAAWGVGIGLAGAWAMARVARSLLFATSPADPAIYAGVAAVLTIVAIAASAPPAWRAMRLDPIRAMRGE